MKIKLHIILRSFNNDKIVNVIHRISLSPIPITSVNVAIDKEKDLGKTPNLISELNYTFPIQPILLENYGWSKALNVAIDNLPLVDASASEFVMPISNEVMIEPEDFQLLLDAANQEKASCGYALFKKRYEPSYSIPRNTCIVWKRNLLSTIDPFKECLDNHGGMEDYEMVLRVFDRLGLLPFAAKRRIGLIIRDPENFLEKIKNEEDTIKKIEEHYNYSQEIVDNLKEHLKNQGHGL